MTAGALYSLGCATMTHRYPAKKRRMEGYASFEGLRSLRLEAVLLTDPLACCIPPPAACTTSPPSTYRAFIHTV